MRNPTRCDRAQWACATFSVSRYAPAIRLSLVLICVLWMTASYAAPPVYPDLVGFGVTTRAAYAGADQPEIMRVTSLADSGPGTLREAIESEKPRIIVFEVGGRIELVSRLRVRSPYMTLAGETAPEPGITVVNESIEIRAHDIHISHLRIRVGDKKTSDVGGARASRDALTICCGQSERIVLRNLSLSWSIDELFATSMGQEDAIVRDVTLANSVLSEGLHDSIHPKGPHSMGILIAEGSQNIALIGNVLAHNADRNPYLKGDTSAVFLNNVVYNWRRFSRATYIRDAAGDGAVHATIVGNHYLRGPDTPRRAWAIGLRREVSPASRIVVAGNSVSGVEPLRNESSVPVEAEVVAGFGGMLVSHAEMKDKAAILMHSGARPAYRDNIDIRILESVEKRSGKIIDSQEEVGGWGEIPSTQRRLTLPDKPHQVCISGYTRLELMLIEMSHQVENVRPAVDPGNTVLDVACMERADGSSGDRNDQKRDSYE